MLALKSYPKSFDSEIYKTRNPDLNNFDSKSLFKHYNYHGMEEGRICSLVESSEKFYKLIKVKNERALEIGPLFNPKLDFNLPNVKSLDHLSLDDLRKKYADDPNVDIDRIVKTDYIWGGEPYSELIAYKFKYIVACHVIEHSPDLISFLNNLSEILSRNGYIFLSIPDKRYCFDHFRPETTLDEVLFAHENKHVKPTISNIKEHYSTLTHNFPVRHWAGDHGETSEYSKSKLYIENKIKQSHNSYVDTHVWKFKPANFEEIMSYLYRKSLINLRVIRLYPTLHNTFEFFCILKKNPWKRIKNSIH